jgi:TPR repeat protein
LGGAGQGRNQLGLLYMEGRGVPQDYVQAYFWFSLNGSGGNAAEAREHLSPVQIRGVERLIDEWKQQHRPSPELAAALQTMEANSRSSRVTGKCVEIGRIIAPRQLSG